MTGPVHRRPTAAARGPLETPAPSVTSRRTPAPVDADPVAAGSRLRALPPGARAAETRRLQRAYGNSWVQRATAPLPLPDPLRTRMEAAFGESLGDVRISEGPEAEALDAVAFTSGSRIVFRPGSYDPHSPEGQEVLGHELTHVLQQRAGRVTPGSAGGLTEDPALEAEAEQAGRRAARGEQVALHADGTAAPPAGGGGVAQPLRLPGSRRRPPAAFAPPGAPEPADPVVESRRLHEIVQQKLSRMTALNSRGDGAGVEAVLQELDVLSQHIKMLSLIQGGFHPVPSRPGPGVAVQPPPRVGGGGAPDHRAEDDYEIMENGVPVSMRPSAPDPVYDQTPADPVYGRSPAADGPGPESPYAPARSGGELPVRGIGEAAATAHHAIDEIVRRATGTGS